MNVISGASFQKGLKSEHSWESFQRWLISLSLSICVCVYIYMYKILPVMFLWRFLMKTLPIYHLSILFIFLFYFSLHQNMRLMRQKVSFFSSFLRRTLISFLRAPISLPNYFPEAPPLNITILGVKMSTDDFKRDKNIQTRRSSDLMFYQAIYSLETFKFSQ